MIKAAAAQGWSTSGRGARGADGDPQGRCRHGDHLPRGPRGAMAVVRGARTRAPLGRAVRRGARAHPGRRVEPRARLAVGWAGPSALPRPRRGRLGVGRRRQPLRRLRGVVGPADRRPRASRGRRGRARGRRARGTTFGAPTEVEVELAERSSRRFPSIEQVRFVSSGTEAAMSALRLARAFTGRDRIMKFDGGYHGHADALLVAGRLRARDARASRLARRARRRAAADTLVVPLQRPRRRARARFEQHAGADRGGHRRAGGRQHGRRPAARRLPRAPARDLTREHGALLIFDEVITGFRVALRRRAGALRRHARPDLPGQDRRRRAAGRRRSAAGATSWSMLAPLGPVYQAGTLSGNPLAMAAGLATLRLLREPRAYERLERTSAALEAALAGPGRDGEPGRRDADGVLPPGPVPTTPTPPGRTPPGSPRSRADARPAACRCRRRSSSRDAVARPHRRAARQTAAAAAEFAGERARDGRGAGCRGKPALGLGAPREAARRPALLGPCPERHLLGVETIYEGYLLHHGTSRLFDQDDRELACSPATTCTPPACARSAPRRPGTPSAPWPSSSRPARPAEASASPRPTTASGTRPSPAWLLSSRGRSGYGVHRSPTGVTARARASMRSGPARAGTAPPWPARGCRSARRRRRRPARRTSRRRPAALRGRRAVSARWPRPASARCARRRRRPRAPALGAPAAGRAARDLDDRPAAALDQRAAADPEERECVSSTCSR